MDKKEDGEKEKEYISLWSDDAKPQGFSLFKKLGFSAKNGIKQLTNDGVKGCWHTYEQDKESEGGREPDSTTELFNLEVNVIHQLFRKLQADTPNWSARNNNKTEGLNCATLSAYLLKLAGIEDLFDEGEKAFPELAMDISKQQLSTEEGGINFMINNGARIVVRVLGSRIFKPEDVERDVLRASKRQQENKKEKIENNYLSPALSHI